MADFPVSAAVLDAAADAFTRVWPEQGALRAALSVAGPLLLAERLRVISDQLAAAGPWLEALRVSPEGSACVAVAAIRADLLRAAKELEGAVEAVTGG